MCYDYILDYVFTVVYQFDQGCYLQLCICLEVVTVVDTSVSMSICLSNLMLLLVHYVEMLGTVVRALNVKGSAVKS